MSDNINEIKLETFNVRKDKIEISNKAYNNIKIYFNSKDNDQYYKEKSQPSYDIYETIKEYLGVELENTYIDEDGKIFITEKNNGKTNILKFDNNSSIGDYIEYLINLSILNKLNNEKLDVIKSNNRTDCNIIKKNNYFEKFDLAMGKYGIDWSNHIDEFDITEEKYDIYNGEINSLQNERGDVFSLKIEDIKDKLKEKFLGMSISDIKDSQLSPFEVRKLIVAQYGNIKLSEEEINAIGCYKGGWFEKINSFLIGNIDIENEEKFFKNDFEEIIKKVGLIYSAQKKFRTDRDIVLLRTDSVKENIEKGINYDNFVSTTIAPQTFDRRYGRCCNSIL